MCLLVALSRMVDGAPLVVAANRDEYYQRPAKVIDVLRDGGPPGGEPRILGGRDLAAGGTWLAVNAGGVLAGLTNQPAGGRDPAKRTRGELPLMFAAYPDAATAVAQVCARLDPADYNPCWLLVGDRDTLFSVGLAGGPRPVVQELPPGRYVLENVPLGAPSAKADRVGANVAARLAIAKEAEEIGVAGAAGANGAVDALQRVLCDHEVPGGTGEPGGTGGQGGSGNGRERPAELAAACVHLAGHDYGTRSAMIVAVPWAGTPQVLVADGTPCRAPFTDVTQLWDQADLARVRS
ncbi:MAG: NRDE family protein [Actinomycetota bacterium]